MANTHPYANGGSVSHGTLQLVDTIPAFERALNAINNKALSALVKDPDDSDISICANNAADDGGCISLLAQRINRRRGRWIRVGLERRYNERINEDCAAEWLAEYAISLTDALNEHAPDGFMFGAHEGDGSDFGFWPIPCEVCANVHPEVKHEADCDWWHGEGQECICGDNVMGPDGYTSVDVACIDCASD